MGSQVVVIPLLTSGVLVAAIATQISRDKETNLEREEEWKPARLRIPLPEVVSRRSNKSRIALNVQALFHFAPQHHV